MYGYREVLDAQRRCRHSEGVLQCRKPNAGDELGPRIPFFSERRTYNVL